MPPVKKVFLFIVSVLFLYCLLSFIAIRYGFNFLPANNINLLGDVVSAGKKKSKTVPFDSSQNKTVDSVTSPVTNEIYSFNNYKYPGYITAFQKDTLTPSLNRFNAKLLKLKQGEKVKIRIAYLGDSMIEDDLLTQTLRKLLQHFFGGYGVGFVPITSHNAAFRSTASAEFSNNWQDDNFKNASVADKQTLFFSGHTYYGNNSWVVISDNTTPGNTLLEKFLLCGHSDNNILEYNDRPFTINTLNNFNRVLLSTDYSKKVKLNVNDASLPVYGISFESPSGIFVDNFSFRGVSGIELNGINQDFLKTIDQNNPYDLIILGYGVNLLYRPNDLNFDWYRKLFSPVLKKFKQSFPNSDMVMVSTADRAFRYNGEYKSAKGIDSVIKLQAELSFNNGICFYNQFATMGGKNSIVKWANEKPALASKDYIHPNARGAAILAGYFFDAIVNDYNKYIATTNAANKTN